MSLRSELTPIEPASLSVTEDALVISIPLASLAAWARDKWTAEDAGLMIFDIRTFAEGIKDAIQQEDECGNWPLHALIDSAIEQATEDDLPGVEEV